MVSMALRPVLPQKQFVLKNQGLHFGSDPTEASLADKVTALFEASINKNTLPKEYARRVEAVAYALPGCRYRLDTPLKPSLRTTGPLPYLSGCSLLEVIILSQVRQEVKNQALKSLNKCLPGSWDLESTDPSQNARTNLCRIWVTLACNNNQEIMKQWKVPSGLQNALREMSALQSKAKSVNEYVSAVCSFRPEDPTLKLLAITLGFLRYPYDQETLNIRLGRIFQDGLQRLNPVTLDQQYLCGTILGYPSSYINIPPSFPPQVHLVANGRVLQANPDDSVTRADFKRAVTADPGVRSVARDMMEQIVALHPQNEWARRELENLKT